MEQLSRQDERTVRNFSLMLFGGVETVNDMFPPDDTPPPAAAAGVREPRPPLPPTMPLSRRLVMAEAELCLARIDLTLAAA